MTGPNNSVFDDGPSNLSGLALFTSRSLDRKITILMLFISILLLGVIATINIPLEVFPSGYTGPNIRVWIPWFGAPPKEVLDRLIIPLEEEFSTIRGLAEIRSFARLGSASLNLTFKQRVNMNVAYREVRDRVERARVRLPEEIDRVYLSKEDVSGIPVFVAGILVDPSIDDPYDLVDREILRAIQRIDGVASARVDGLSQKEVLIEIDREKIESAGVNLYEITRRLQNDNFTLASGYVTEGGKKFLLRSDTRFRSLEELQNRKITPTVRLKDVATVKLDVPERPFVVHVNGRPAGALVVMKESRANTVTVCKRIRATLEALRANPRLSCVDVKPVFDQGRLIVASLMQLVDSGIIGAGVAALILFFFLQQFRLTLLIAMAIPLSMLCALVVMYFAGETLNIITILGLFISAGMLLDNSIVVSENIFRHSQEGTNLREACVQGTTEVWVAILTATLTTIVVFLPVALIEGQGQFFLIRFVLPVGVSLVASLGVAIVFIPLVTYLTLKRSTLGRGFQRPGRLQPILAHFYDMSFARLNRTYVRILKAALHQRLELVLLTTLLLWASWYFAFRRLQFVEQQEEDRTQFEIVVEAPHEYSFSEMATYFEEVEGFLKQKQHELYIDSYLVIYRAGWGRIEGWLRVDRPRDISAKKVGMIVLNNLPRRPGMVFRFGRETQGTSPKSEALFVMELQGDNFDQLEEAGRRLESVLLSVPGVVGLRGHEELPPQELGLVMKKEQIEATGTMPQIVAGIVAYALRGVSLRKVVLDGREIPVRARFEKADRESLSRILSLRIPRGKSSAQLPVGSLVQVSKFSSPREIQRLNRKLIYRFLIELDPDRAKAAVTRLIQLQNEVRLPEGVSFNRASFQEVDEEFKNMISAGLLSVLFNYLLMGALFESFVLPLSILFTIPMAGVGMGWFHRIAGLDVDFLGAVGAVLLTGIVVNNGIVLIDYINKLRGRGLPREEAVLVGSRLRFRPVLMTALTTIFAMIPLALSRRTEVGISYRSFALTLIGGLTSSTLLTLLVVPTFYTIFDDAQQFLRRLPDVVRDLFLSARSILQSRGIV